MPVDVRSLLSPDGAIARRLEGFEPRPQQMEMARAVQRTLEQKTRLIVEAGTGVGKSFAYLIPAIKRIVENDERIVIVTNTINLQEQLIEKDIPLLNAVIPEEFTAVLVKGRGNYVSLRRLRLASERQDRLLGDDESRHSLHIIEDWARSTRDGTLATLPRLPRMDVWDYAQSDAHNCMGRKCPTYDKCFYQAARRRMENGDLLVCNHALFFSDLALRARGVGFLPPYDHVILDEAHSAEDVAADHFGISLSEGRVRHLLRLLYHPRQQRGFLAGLRLKDGGTDLIDRTIEQALRCNDAMEALASDLTQWRRRSAPRNGRVPEPNVVANPLTPAMKQLGHLLKLLKQRAAAEHDEYELNSYAQRAHEIAEETEMLIGQELEGCVYFLEGVGSPSATGRVWGPLDPLSLKGGGESAAGVGSASMRSRRRPRLTLRCAAVEVAPILRERLFGQEIGVVLTSATLATGPAKAGAFKAKSQNSNVDADDSQLKTLGADNPEHFARTTRNSQRFSHIITRLGFDRAKTLLLGSPFDYAAQMSVHIDRAMPDPNEPNYVDELCPRIERHVRGTGGGAFVLFTSFNMLHRVAERLRPALSSDGYPVLVHGTDGPPGLLLKRFRDDEKSVLLGTVSFWQGVDVRGRGLRNVIITRLPFEVPDLPLLEARHEKIRERGGNPFMDDSVPRAVIRFKQGIGRLIRSKTDEGRIVILDPRIATKRYGRLFLDALPHGTAAAADAGM